MLCLFCSNQESNYRPTSSIDFICSRCVTLLGNADQDDLKGAYAKAIEKGYTNKAKAIESFLIDRGKNEQRKPKSKKHRRHSDRTRINRTVGSKKERIKRFAVSTSTTVL
jgi:hypothetical protein